MSLRAGEVRRMRGWIAERESVRCRKESGSAPPWTNDPVLRTYRFTNVSRRFDRMTGVLADHMANARTPADRFVSAVAFRAFNRLTTWAELRHMSSARGWDERDGVKRLRALSRSGLKICSGVWMSCGREGEPVWRSGLRTVTASVAVATRGSWRASMADCYAELQTLPFVGVFTANEMLMDIAYLTGDLDSAPDRLTFVRLGPGAVRGLRRLQGKPPGTGLTQPRPTAEDWAAFESLAAGIRGDPPARGTELTVHDVEHCLCEYDKYRRAQGGQALKNKYRYKKES